MLRRLYSVSIRYPKATIATIVVLTALFASQLTKLRWETDARVYLPKGHEAIIYDEKVDDIFGVKDNIIVGIVNEKEGVFNYETLSRIARLTEKIAALPGVQATRKVDVSSLSTATLFVGSQTEIGTKPLMEKIPQTPAEMEKLKKLVYDNADLYIGNIVSADGKAAMIRAKIKEGMQHRYETYFRVKTLIAEETGDWSGMQQNWGGNSNQWNANNASNAASTAATNQFATSTTTTNGQNQWPQIGQAATDAGSSAATSGQSSPSSANSNIAASTSSNGQNANGNPWWPGNNQGGTGSAATEKKNLDDQFYLAGRPVIEVSSGIFALDDMRVMVPAVILVMAVVLLLMFRSLRGMLLPLFALGTAIIWTMGLMAMLDVPMYTISTMLPVVLVAVCIGDGVHLMSAYFDSVLSNPHRSGAEIMAETVQKLGVPLVMTSVTTAIGFLTLMFADMPPFQIFGVFAMIGILFSWLVSITFLPAMLSVLKPRVANYYEKRRAMRVYEDQGLLARFLTSAARWIDSHRRATFVVIAVVSVVSVAGATRLFVNSSWLSDFREDSEVFRSTAMLNEKFSGTVFLNIVIESEQKDALKDPVVLHKMEALQDFVATIPYVGDSLSVVDYLKNMNKSLHSDDPKFNVIPASNKEIAEYLFLFSVSGRPEQLDQVVDYEYKTGLISVAIKTDYTKHLKHIIDEVRRYTDKEFAGTNVRVNFSGSANNSFIWAKLLIGSQLGGILFSKIAILFVAALVMASLLAGVFVVVPVTLSTIIVGGIAGIVGIPMDVSTALAAGVAIGVGVDYAIHYIYRYRIERQTKEHLEAMISSMRTIGRTIVLNALVVIAGFAVLFLSSFPPHVKLGYFIVSYMVASCVIALVVLPTLLVYYKPKTARTAG